MNPITFLKTNPKSFETNYNITSTQRFTEKKTIVSNRIDHFQRLLHTEISQSGGDAHKGKPTFEILLKYVGEKNETPRSSATKASLQTHRNPTNSPTLR
jgi:hypothetical protein